MSSQIHLEIFIVFKNINQMQFKCYWCYNNIFWFIRNLHHFQNKQNIKLRFKQISYYTKLEIWFVLFISDPKFNIFFIKTTPEDNTTRKTHRQTLVMTPGTYVLNCKLRNRTLALSVSSHWLHHWTITQTDSNDPNYTCMQNI